MSTRHVMENTFITDSDGREYLLRAGSIVVMPATAHMEGDVWGINKIDFDPERFLDWEDHKASRDRRLIYMPFGGGRHLCPGRNLAKAEILGFIVMLILSFDMEDGANLEQPIRVPTLEPARLGQGVGKPVYLRTGDKFPVRLRTRKGLESVNWRFLA
ncbi:uncharacterized protein NFIA_098930 [Aspergillus fischeri NRRL 181]|uniref:Cytochrome P450 n=1 Tax=Neosartorya fischeri (strain ATCC 1020 / DSM 3700 / CBS 544.65 / FGSC A1164 / JCM 1740 / NRRL 181 / WB 181) TaxID=331117 RepID=A1DBL9_NEOFI|nr:uncharacterized protein NFIA_098930 [Aspergillus fischeri NRRL 181]EAW20259.1 hypothetical protein NFIA_098930 [Aspergillus fischeri NRRL 181]